MGNGFSQYAAGAAFAFGIAAAGAFGANGAMKENAAMTDASELPLWYSAPAETWEEALPIGNGRLGAMIFGGLDEERLQFNEDTLWTGRPRDYTHAGAAAHLGEVRRLLFAGGNRKPKRWRWKP